MTATDARSSEVTIVDIKMPFMSMVIFMIKWAFAAIPAFIILGLISMLFSSLIMGMFIAANS